MQHLRVHFPPQHVGERAYFRVPPEDSNLDSYPELPGPLADGTDPESVTKYLETRAKLASPVLGSDEKRKTCLRSKGQLQNQIADGYPG